MKNCPLSFRVALPPPFPQTVRPAALYPHQPLPSVWPTLLGFSGSSCVTCVSLVTLGTILSFLMRMCYLCVFFGKVPIEVFDLS